MEQFYSIMIFLFGAFDVQSNKLNSFYEINSIELEYDMSLRRKLDIKSGLYKPETVFPTDIAIYHQEDCEQFRLFTALPRADTTIPATLVEVVEKDGIRSFKPYPKWSWHRIIQINPCKKNSLRSVHKIAIDRCGRLWALDEGIYKGPTKSIKCPKQLLAFDLKKNKLVHRYIFPNDGFHETAHILSLLVDVANNGTCEKTHVYVSDGASYSIIVYSMELGTSWVFKHNTLVPNEEESSVTSKFYEIGMGLNNNNGQFFYTPFAGVDISSIQTSILNNEVKLLVKEVNSLLQVNTYPSPRSSKIGSFAIDEEGISYFNLLDTNSLMCWNTNNTNYGDNIHLIQQFPGIINIQVIKNDCATFLYVLSSQQEENFPSRFQISYAKTEDIIADGLCG